MDESQIMTWISKGLSLTHAHVNEITASVRQYNQLVSSSDQELTIKDNCDQLDTSWTQITTEYAELNVKEYVIDCLYERGKLDNFLDSDGNLNDRGIERARRVSVELALFKKHNLEGVLKAIIYIINTLYKNEVVWGVGRGSSVSSYVLYLVGAHDVDSVEYDLNINDFLHE